MAILKGRGELRALPPEQDVFEVDYEIEISSRPVGRGLDGLPPRTRPTIEAKITAADGRLIPDGQYALTDDKGAAVFPFHIAKDFGKWYGLNP
jgi:hypothetical protein